MAKANVFMIMPFKDEYFEVYEMLKEHFVDEFQFNHAGDDINTQQNILKDIIQMIYEADVIIADLTGQNPNVFYELGVAHTLNKKVIIISRDLSELPFDIRSYRATEYSTHFKKFDYLVKELARYMKGAIDGTVAFGNPVMDFKATIDRDKSFIPSNEADSDEVLGEKGLIDFLADIEEHMDIVTKALNDIADGMKVMSSGVEHSTHEVERVKQSGGSGTASFIRKETRKVADHISVYSNSLKRNNLIFSKEWSTIEQSCLLLLENKHAGTPENNEGMIIFLKSIHTMKENSMLTHAQVSDFLKTFTGLRGIQSSLNQAIASLEIDVKQFISFIEQMCSSIDRILEKSVFVVGRIDYSTM